MTDPTTMREAMLAEIAGEFPEMIAKVEALMAMVAEACQALQQADADLRKELEGFERRTLAMTEHMKTTTARYIATRTDEAARQSIERQSRAMADAARVAFGVELGATMERLRVQLQPLLEERARGWQRWLPHAAAAGAAASATWLLMVNTMPH